MSRTLTTDTVLGLDIGGTKTAIVEGTCEAEIVQRVEVPTDAKHPFEETFFRLAEHMDTLRRKAKDAGRQVTAVSVSVGGPLRIEDGVLLNPPHLPGWHGTKLKAQLTDRFPDLPVFIEHDGNAGALAECNFGVGRGCPELQHLIFLTFGTGLGAGLIVNGRVVRGTTDMAGEVGRWHLTDKEPMGFGEATWESFASGAGLVQLAHHRFPKHWPKETPIHDLVEDMLSDNPEALAVAEEAGMWLGRGLAILVNALNPQLIVLGTLAVVLGKRVLEPARQTLAKEAPPRAVNACDIVPAALGKEIGDVAALMAALTQR